MGWYIYVFIHLYVCICFSLSLYTRVCVVVVVAVHCAQCTLNKLTIIFNEHANFISETKQTKLATMCNVEIFRHISSGEQIITERTSERAQKKIAWTRNKRLIPPKMHDARRIATIREKY